MARTVEITGSLSGGDALERQVRGEMGKIVRARLEQVGKEMVATANALMAADFNLSRPIERRRHPGSRRASEALDYAITGDDDRLTLGFRVLGGEDVFKRILIMNYGSRPHRIYPSGAWALTGVRDFTRAVGSGRRVGTQPMLAWTDEDSGEQVVTPEVDHPGTAGSGFLEEARDLAADSLRARVVP
jgi:hypothetical protein